MIEKMEISNIKDSETYRVSFKNYEKKLSFEN
jgi:hypothetical protein